MTTKSKGLTKFYAAALDSQILGLFTAKSQKEAEEILETDYPEANRLFKLVCSWPD